MSRMMINKLGKEVDVSKLNIRVSQGMKTPCVDICTMDNNSGYCIGCARNKNEIAFWSYDMTDKDRDDVIDELQDRKQYIKYPEKSDFTKKR
ncbi:hypothetical protein DLAC_03285 [Tieghemostelium lacteum]|uniref:DUF1289 domain-containing protein n=1 Tax=Tieghemostelium lacteum TaxID=361077 RepID=A0A152A1K0_TIELA|nr:hypothetical protein DLAC_03285 [Tieghemostelium lacteum]|eukprot:KYR00133.1 hypothetical protein DLAC_03285 [Tieghemostelium lacteum]